MPIIGSLLKQGIKLGKSIEQENTPPFKLQKKELKKLLKKAELTQFGIKYNFDGILKNFGIIRQLKGQNPKDFYTQFKSQIPVHSYNKIYSEWWHKCLEGEADVTWPGLVRYFALSSGTSEAATKHIPITNDMIKAIKKTSLRQMLALKNYNFEPEILEKGILMLGGSTSLNSKGHYFEGDLSGISASKIPFWFQRFYKPGKAIAQNRDWNKKLEEITLTAINWDIGFVVGVPAWIQLLLEKIIAHYKVNNIHEIWPNLSGFCHGGVAFEPYRTSFEKLLGRPIAYIETYLASEGFIAFQVKPDRRSMRMMLNSGIFYEFVPFTDDNFEADGEIKSNPQTFMIDEVEEGKDYALLLTTCAGTWRYLIGDVIRFVNKKESEIIITGRTKHFLSLCGEHLSVDNMNKAIRLVSEELNVEIKEFAVAGVPFGSTFGHHWYIGSDSIINESMLAEKLDAHLKNLNDDYRVERAHVLTSITVEVLPTNIFYAWLKHRGKEGGQNKFPRVLKSNLLPDWKSFISTNS